MFSISPKTRSILLFAMSLCYLFISNITGCTLWIAYFLAIAGLISIYTIKKDKKDE